MIGRVIVMEPSSTSRMAHRERARRNGRRRGCAAAISKFGCGTCHGVRAPTLAGVYGNRVTSRTGARLWPTTIICASQFWTRSEVVAGFPTSCRPSRPDLARMTRADSSHIIKSSRAHDHNRGLKRTSPSPAKPRFFHHVRLSERGYSARSWLLTTDHKRIGILYMVVDYALLFRRRRRGALMRSGCI